MRLRHHKSVIMWFGDGNEIVASSFGFNSFGLSFGLELGAEPHDEWDWGPK